MKSSLASLMVPFALMAGLNEPVNSIGGTGRKHRVNWKSYGPGNSQRKRRKYARQNHHSKYAK